MFPNIFVGAMLVFSLIWLISESVFKRTAVLEAVPWKEILWGLLAIGVFLFAAQWIGFLVASLLVFFVIGVGFSPNKKNYKTILISAAASAAFMGIIYCLFNFLLKVQIPEGIL